MDFQHGGNVWTADGEKGAVPQKVTDFSANLNPLGPPPGICGLLRKKIACLQFYPEPYARTFCAACAAKLGVGADQVIAGNGASELISLFFWATRPRRVLIPAPAYSDYARAALAAGSEVEFFFSGEDFAFSLETLARQAALARCDALVLGSPNNPTGVFWEDLTPLLKELAVKKLSLLLDASFLPFTGVAWPAWREQNRFLSFWQEDVRRNGGGLFIVFSLTKIFAFPGLRLGLGFGPPALIQKLKGATDPWSVNTPAQLAGPACLREEAYVQKTVAYVEKERKYLERGLKRIPGLKVFPSRANFLLVNCRRTGRTGAEIAAALAAKGLLIRDAGNFPGLDEFFFRLAVRRRSENRYLLRALAEVLA